MSIFVTFPDVKLGLRDIGRKYKRVTIIKKEHVKTITRQFTSSVQS